MHFFVMKTAFKQTQSSCLKPVPLRYLAGLCLLVLFNINAWSQVYKYVDENGLMTYTNVKPSDKKYSIKVIGCYGTCKRRIDWNNVALNTTAYAVETAALADEFSLDEATLRALIHAESSFNPKATSPKGAQGLTQLMPSTAQDLNVTDAYSPEQNLRGGAQYLREMLDMFNNDTDKALAAYNAGPTAVKKYNGIPPYAETTEYVKRINTLRARYRAKLRTSAVSSVSAVTR